MSSLSFSGLRRRRAPLLKRWGGVLLLAALAAARADAVQPAPAKVTDDDLRIGGVFTSALPGTEEKNRLKLIVDPRFNNYSGRLYVRLPVGLRYGLTSRWEAKLETEVFLGQGIGSESHFGRKGLANVHLGTKYRIGTGFWPGWDTAVGLDAVTPTGNPPSDISDGLRHVGAFATFSHHLVSRPGWRVFWSAAADEVRRTGRPIVLTKNALADNTVTLSGGFVHQAGTVNYTFEVSVTSTRLTGATSKDVVTLRPGLVWQVPPKYTFHARGQWLIGIGVRGGFGPDGTTLGASAKVRANFDFKRWLRGNGK